MEVLELEQLTEDWFEAKAGIPSVSRFSDFITPARGDYSKSAIRYIARLIRETVSGPVHGYTSDAMMYGIATEAEARMWYELQYDCDVEQVGLILNKGAAWSPDGRVNEVVKKVRGYSEAGDKPLYSHTQTKGAVEFKCAEEETHIMWLLNGGLPVEHKPQCHGALNIGELDWLDFVSYCPGYRSLVVRVVPDDYTKKVAAALETFLEQYQAAKGKVFG
ncbi:MAG: YqaJ viral recombinase family protein [Gammaproteobacteria bacterium]